MKVIELRLKPNNGKPLKAFADLELDNGIVIKEFRIIQRQTDHKPFVVSPQISWKDQETGEVKYNTVVTIPNPLKAEVDALILSSWFRIKEQEREANRVK